MKIEDYEQLSSFLLRVAQETEDAKRPGYTVGSEDVLANFKAVGERINRPAEEVCMIYFLKHVDSITAMVRRPELPQSEDMTGRFADAMNYIKLLYALLKEREYDTVMGVDDERSTTDELRSNE